MRKFSSAIATVALALTPMLALAAVPASTEPVAVKKPKVKAVIAPTASVKSGGVTPSSSNGNGSVKQVQPAMMSVGSAAAAGTHRREEPPPSGGTTGSSKTPPHVNHALDASVSTTGAKQGQF